MTNLHESSAVDTLVLTMLSLTKSLLFVCAAAGNDAIHSLVLSHLNFTEV